MARTKADIVAGCLDGTLPQCALVESSCILDLMDGLWGGMALIDLRVFSWVSPTNDSFHVAIECDLGTAAWEKGEAIAAARGG